MEDKLKKLEETWKLIVRDTVTEKDFTDAFAEVIKFIKNSNSATASILSTIIKRLDDHAQQLKSDTDEDRKLIRQMVGQAMAEMRTELEKRASEIKDGAPGKDGKDADEEMICNQVLALMPQPEKVEPETPDGIVEKINKSGLQIAKERIEGLVDAIRIASANAVSGAVGVTTTIFFKNGTQVGRAKNINFIEGQNATLTLYQTGDQMNVQVTSTGASGGTIVDAETPTDSGDHTNFTIAHTPNAGTFKLYRGGARQLSGTDYTLTGTALVLTTPLDAADGEIIIVDYTY